MHVVRITDAPGYEAPGHHLMQMRRLQGREAGPTDTVWLGVSAVAPGGGTTLDASAVEKIYVLLEGEIVLSNGMEEVRLSALDSCRLAPGEARQLRNESAALAVVLLVMPLQPLPSTTSGTRAPAHAAGTP